MKLFILITSLLLAQSAWAQSTPYDLKINVTDGAVVWYYRITPAITGDSNRCFYDYDNTSLDRRSYQLGAGTAGGGYRAIGVSDLTAADEVWFSCETSNVGASAWSPALVCPVTCTDCQGTDDDASADPDFFATDSGGIDCTEGDPPRFTTLADQDNLAVDPPDLSGVLQKPPTPTVAPITVASDCSDFATKFDQAEAEADDGDVVELVLPSAGVCAIPGSPGIVLRQITNGGWVVIRPDSDEKLLPPPGAMTDKTRLPFMAKLTWTGVQNNNSGYVTFIDADAANTRGYYFVNVDISPPQYGSSLLNPIDLTITAIDTSTDTLTTSSDLSALLSRQTVWSDLSVGNVRGGQGVLHICSITVGAGTFKLGWGQTNGSLIASPTTSCTNTADLVGSNCSGTCGTVRRVGAIPVESWQDCGDGVQCATVTSHKLGNYLTMPITGSPSSTQLNVTGTPSEYQIGTSASSTRNGAVVMVEGTGVGTCDGLRRVTGVSGSTLTLTRSGQTTNCTGASTGTVRAHRAVSVIKTTSAILGDTRPMAHNILSEDADTLRFLEVPTQSGATGGYIFLEEVPQGRVGRITQNNGVNPSTQIVFDRVSVRACLTGTYQTFLGSFDGVASQGGIINSWLETCLWTRTNPVSGQNEQIFNQFQGAGRIGLRDSQNFVINNNYGMAAGVNWFADGDSSPPITLINDMDFSKNLSYNPEWMLPSLGATYRYHRAEAMNNWEIKSAGARLRYNANRFKHYINNFNANAPLMFISVPAPGTSIPSNGAQHLDMSYNIAERGGFQFVQLSATIFGAPSGGGSDRLWQPFGPVRVYGNLITGVDVSTYNEPGAYNATGLFIWNLWPVRHMQIRRNTYAPKSCTDCRLYQLSQFRGGDTDVVDNIFVVSQGNSSNDMGVATQGSDTGLPQSFTTANQGRDLFQKAMWRGTATEEGVTSSWVDNVHIPGIENAGSGTYSVKAASKANADTICADELYTKGRMVGLDTGNTTVGAAGACSGGNVDSLDQRMNLVFKPGSWEPISTYAADGAPVDDVRDQMGLCGPVAVTADDDQFNLAFHSPDNEEVYVTYVAFDTDLETTLAAMGSGTRGLTANGATQSKTFSATGLTAETQYLYRIEGGVDGGGCRKGSIGLVTTAGAP